MDKTAIRQRSTINTIRRWFAKTSPLAILFLLAGLTCAVTYAAYQRHRLDELSRFERLSSRLTVSIEQRMATFTSALQHTEAFYHTHNSVTREEFDDYVSGLRMNEYPGLRGIGFARKMSPEALPKEIKEVRSLGVETFNVWPEGLREIYFPITYLWPPDPPNLQAIGYDMFSEPKRREAMEVARDTGEAAVTSKVVLVQEGAIETQKESFGFLIYVPVYKRGSSIKTVEERRAALQGFIYGPFRADDVFEEILKVENRTSTRISLEVFDGDTVSEESKVFSSVKADQEKTLNQVVLPVRVANHGWSVRLTTLAPFDSEASRNFPWYILIAGSAITLLSYLFARMASQYNESVERNENQLRLVTDALPMLISYVGPDRHYRFKNRAYREWFDSEVEDELDVPVDKVIGNELSNRAKPHLERALKGEHVRFEIEANHKTLGRRVVAAQYIPDRDPNGKVRGVVALGNDVTELKENESRLREQSRVVELVSSAGLSLRSELDLESIVQRVTDITTELSHAKFGAFFYNTISETGESLTLYTISGVPREAFSKFPHPRNTKIFAPTFSGERIVRSDDILQDPNFGKMGPHYGMPAGHLPVRSYLAVPVISRTGDVIGGLFFGHPEKGVFTERAEILVSGIAAQAAVAIDNSRLYQRLKGSEARSRDFARAQSFLAEAGQLLSASLDANTILTSLAELAVPRIADWCSVTIVQPDGSLRQLHTTHKDIGTMKKGAQILEKYPQRTETSVGAPNVIRTGLAELYETITDENLKAVATSPEHLELLKSFGMRSAISVPLKNRERTIGALTLILSETPRNYDENDLAFAEDLARRASVAVENARLYAEAQAINRIKDEFLATLSHELRTPLNVILGHAELLKEETEDLKEQFSEDLESSIEAIYRNALSQNQIIGDLLDVSAIITGKMSFNPVQTSLKEVTELAAEGIRFAAEAKGVALNVKLEDSSCPLLGDPTRIQQIIWNLLSNAVKFTPRGGRIDLSIREETSQYVVEVADTGLGIEPNFLPYVFDRFRQEDNSMTRKFGGLGLGLSIVRQLVELHGGTITVTSRGKGQGTTFRIVFPTAQARLETDARTSASASTEASLSTRESSPRKELGKTLSGLQILVVDDETDARELIAKIFRRVGANVMPASSMQEALEFYKERRPDLIVSDVGMPEHDGFEFIRKIREIERQSGTFTPAAALTAYARNEDRDQALEAGFQAHVAKPVESAALIRVVEELIEA